MVLTYFVTPPLGIPEDRNVYVCFEIVVCIVMWFSGSYEVCTVPVGSCGPFVNQFHKSYRQKRAKLNNSKLESNAYFSWKSTGFKLFSVMRFIVIFSRWSLLGVGLDNSICSLPACPLWNTNTCIQIYWQGRIWTLYKCSRMQ